jgi:hypothetical protein
MTFRAVVAVVLALLAPLFFPAALTVAVVLIASLVVPPVGVLAGVLTDALYRTPDVPPYATLVGLAFTIGGFIVHRFVKTRIM